MKQKKINSAWYWIAFFVIVVLLIQVVSFAVRFAFKLFMA